MPLQFGLLTGKFNRESRFAKSDHRSNRLSPLVLEKSLDVLGEVWPIAEKYHIGMDSFALSFILSHLGVSTVIPGIKTPEQAIANTKNIFRLNQDDLDLLHEMYDSRFEELLNFMQSNG